MRKLLSTLAVLFLIGTVQTQAQEQTHDQSQIHGKGRTGMKKIHPARNAGSRCAESMKNRSVATGATSCSTFEKGAHLNESNLVSLADRTTEEQREIARRGGLASGAARREKKAMREHLEAALQMEHYDLEGHKTSKAAAVTAALVERAISGDVSAARLILAYTDGLPVVRAEVEAPISAEVYARVAAALECDE